MQQVAYMSAILNSVVQKCKKSCFEYHDLNLTVSIDFLIEERGGPVSWCKKTDAGINGLAATNPG